MKLIGSLTSPYVRKVRIVFSEKKVDVDHVTENVWSPDTIIGQTNHTLFDQNIATFDDDGGAYNQADAGGFIKLNALRMRIAEIAKRKRAKN